MGFWALFCSEKYAISYDHSEKLYYNKTQLFRSMQYHPKLIYKIFSWIYANFLLEKRVICQYFTSYNSLTVSLTHKSCIITKHNFFITYNTLPNTYSVNWFFVEDVARPRHLRMRNVFHECAPSTTRSHA